MKQEKKEKKEKLRETRREAALNIGIMNLTFRFEVNVKKTTNVFLQQSSFHISSDPTCSTLAALTLIFNIQQKEDFEPTSEDTFLTK